MNGPYGPAIIDHARSAQLANGYLAAMLIDTAGAEYLMIVHPYGVGNTAVFDPTCASVGHEQTGALPLLYLDRIIRSR